MVFDAGADGESEWLDNAEYATIIVCYCAIALSPGPVQFCARRLLRDWSRTVPIAA